MFNKTLTRPKGAGSTLKRVLSNIQQLAAQDSPTTLLARLSQPFQGERDFRTLRLWALLEQKVQSQMAAQCFPAQAPNHQETISPDQFCPMTSRPRLSTSCTHTSKGDVPSLPVQSPTSLFQSGLFWAAIPPYVSQMKIKVTVRQRGILFGHHVQTTRGTCFDRFHWEAVPKVYHVPEDCRLLINTEE